MPESVSARTRGFPREIVLAALLTACGTADAGPPDPMFEVRRIDVGHATAAVLILDVNGDARPDLVVSGGTGVTVLHGDGTGDFDVGEIVPAGDHPVDLASGDLDHDGSLDLVVANHETSYVTLLFGRTGGYAAGRSGRLEVDVQPHPHAVAVADVDEDGHLDIVVDDRNRERLAVFRGHGDGTFERGVPIDVGGDPYRGMVLTDIDRDGHLDVITPNPRSIAVQLGDGTGRFSPAPPVEPASVPPFGLAVGDFDDDGTLDVAGGSGEGPGRLAFWFGRGDGTFEVDARPPRVIAEGPTKLNQGDVDGDGVDDVLVTSYLGNEIALALGGRDDVRLVRIDLDDNPWDIAAADLNGDGRTDLVTANDGGDRIAVLLARAR